MTQYVQQFSIDYNFPVCFTESLFSVENPTFLSTVQRLETDKRHRIMVIVDSNVAASHPRLISEIDAYAAAFPTKLELVAPPLVVQGGEVCKNDFAHVVNIIEQVNLHSMDRQSFVVVIGGGALLDMACFATAIAHRGIRTIRVPTTVLGQGDSGVGVKNGINFFGKTNFIGTFLPPFAVLNDTTFIETLEHRDKIAGIAEGVKVALLRDPQFFEYLEHHHRELAQAEPAALQYVIRQTADLHLRHIRERGDPFELGSSRPLDYGHWSAHKLESMTGHQVRHGEAVAIGMALDVLYAVNKGYLPHAGAERILNLLEQLGFQLWHEKVGEPALIAGIQEFREHLGGKLHITLLRDVGIPFEVHEMDEGVIRQSIAGLRERSQVSATAK